MKIFIFILIFCLLWNCDSHKTSGESSSIKQISQHDKYLEEYERDVESTDRSVEFQRDDFERVMIQIFPSFAEGHSIFISLNSKEIRFSQITQREDLYRDTVHDALPEAQRGDYLFQKMKQNKSENFSHKLSRSDVDQLIDGLIALKQAKYKSKMAETIDGTAFFIQIYEKDTIVAFGTNFPSSHLERLILKALEISEKYAQDWVTKANILYLKP